MTVKVTARDTLWIDGQEIDPRLILCARPFHSYNNGVTFGEIVLFGGGILCLFATFARQFQPHYDPTQAGFPWGYVAGGVMLAVGIVGQIKKQRHPPAQTFGFTLELPHSRYAVRFTSEAEAQQFLKDVAILRGADLPIRKDEGGSFIIWWS